MDKNAHSTFDARGWFERMAADILNQGFPRRFQVRWLDDEAGWKSMHVIAANEEEAVATVQPIAGRPDVRAYAI